MVFRKKIFLGTLFRKFSYHEKICFWNFLILNYFFIAEKKKLHKKFTIFFSVHQNCKTKKFAISKISNKKFRIIHYFTNVKYKRNIFVKRKIFAQKIRYKKFSAKKQKHLRKKISWDKKNFHKKDFSKKIFIKKIVRKKFS